MIKLPLAQPLDNRSNGMENMERFLVDNHVEVLVLAILKDYATTCEPVITFERLYLKSK